MTDSDTTDRYVELLTDCQSRLYGYIYSLTGRPDVAREILHDTNRKLWEIKDSYDSDREFAPWAFKVAFNQVRTDRKRRKRERLVFLDEETLHALAEEHTSRRDRLDDRVAALETCLGKLKPDRRKLVEDYYHGGASVEALAKRLNRRANTVAVTLHRVRQLLADCIRRAMA